MYESRHTFPQGAALGYGQHFGLQPAPIIAKRPPCALSIENPERCNVGWVWFRFFATRAELRFYRGMDYTKNALDYTQILAQLKARGVLFKDEERAVEVLTNISFP